MTTHRAQHQRLHDSVDELLADYLRHHPNRQPEDITALQLLAWSGAQSATPDEPRENHNGHHNGAAFDEDTPETGT